jgi:hypothetical protein
MSTERILVTGATGFTGGHLCERLAKRAMRCVPWSEITIAVPNCRAGESRFCPEIFGMRSLMVTPTSSESSAIWKIP